MSCETKHLDKKVLRSKHNRAAEVLPQITLYGTKQNRPVVVVSMHHQQDIVKSAKSSLSRDNE